VFDSGVDILAQLKSVDDSIALKDMCCVFHTLGNISRQDCVKKNEFKEKDILSKCLEVSNTMVRGSITMKNNASYPSLLR